MAEKLSEQQLSAILAQQIELAKKDRKTGGRDASRKKALDYYFGNLDAYVPPEENRSRIVSRDVADTINWIMPQIMRAFTASGRMFLAEPMGPNDLQYAEQVTDGLNYVFWNENNGYEVVYAGTWDALLHGDAITKTFYDDTPVFGVPRYHENLTEDERAMLAGEDDVEVLAQTEVMRERPDPLTMEPVETQTFDLKIRRRKAKGRYVVTVIPPEDFLIDGDAKSLEDAAFKAHWERKTRSDLVAMGYDKELVWSIPEAGRAETAEAQARSDLTSGDATDKSMELVDYYECYPWIDVDGDGVAEMVRACYGGAANGVLLDWEVWEDEDPFDNIPCEPIPHRWDSRSVADETIDITDVKTVLTRQLLNNTYWVNNPQTGVIGEVKNPEALTDPQFGQPVMMKSGTQIVPIPREYIGDKALMGIHYMDEVSTRRTGVSNQSMALDPETLQNQSATANQNATDASRSQPEMIARNMAEFGWSKVGRKLLRLMSRHEDGPRFIMVKGKPLEINAKTWTPDMHVNINVGLGTGSRDRDAAMLNTVLTQQIAYTDRIAVAFPDKALEMLPFIHNTLTRFAESTGLKNPELYWPDIDEGEIEAGKQRLAQQPDPEAAKIAADAQAKEAQAQRDHEYRMAQVNAKLTLDKQTAAYSNNQAVLQINGELKLKREQLDAELRLKRELGYAELGVQQELGEAGVAVDAAVKSAASDVHVGGDPG